jgi:hypothetical protein
MPAGGRCREIACDPKPVEGLMAWIKPEFEFVDLCSEVTTYLYRR